MKLRHSLVLLTWCLASLAGLSANAGVIINGTRVIYNAEDKEATLRINNDSTTPSLVQVWLDSGDAKSTPETGKSPFFATPPIFRVDPNKGQTVRIIYAQDPLPTDRESVFWLNILDVPPMPVTKSADDANYMQLAIRSRMKLFYRPTGLPGSSFAAADKVQWTLHQNADGVVLQGKNGSVFNVSMDSAKIVISDKTYEVVTSMIAPKSSAEFVVRDLKQIPTQASQLEYVTINDFGSAVKHTNSLTP